MLWRNIEDSSPTFFRSPEKFCAHGKGFIVLSLILKDGQLPVFALFPLHYPSSGQFVYHHCDSFYIGATEANLDPRG
jgi:hypothetical protein